MRVNEAKHRMMQGKPAIGVGVVLGAPLAAEVLSLAGFHFVLVDNQHGSWNDDSSLSAFRSICLGSGTPMARVQQNDFYTIGRLLDRGAMGIVVPMVHSEGDARAAAHAVRYPPLGGRSAGAFGAAFLGPDYSSRIDQEVFLAVQIESKTAVDHAEEILAVDGVDGCWIGPTDLANSMGVDPSTPEGGKVHEAAILKVLDACQKTGKIPGIADTPETAQRRLDQGFLFVTVGGDSGLLASKAAEILRTFKIPQKPRRRKPCKQ